jgi:hypothetical protein
MIIHPQFVYVHFPKTGGMKMRDLLATIPGAEEVASHHHDSIEARIERDPGFRVGDRTVVVGFRRLPSWLHSRYSFERQRSPHLPHDPQRLAEGWFLEADGQEGFADFYARQWASPWLVENHRVLFVRQEHFAADFMAAFGEHLPEGWQGDLSARTNRSEHDDEAAAVIRSNTDQIYERCTYWAHLEDNLYRTPR